MSRSVKRWTAGRGGKATAAADAERCGCEGVLRLVALGRVLATGLDGVRRVREGRTRSRWGPPARPPFHHHRTRPCGRAHCCACSTVPLSAHRGIGISPQGCASLLVPSSPSSSRSVPLSPSRGPGEARLSRGSLQHALLCSHANPVPQNSLPVASNLPSSLRAHHLSTAKPNDPRRSTACMSPIEGEHAPDAAPPPAQPAASMLGPSTSSDPPPRPARRASSSRRPSTTTAHIDALLDKWRAAVAARFAPSAAPRDDHEPPPPVLDKAACVPVYRSVFPERDDNEKVTTRRELMTLDHKEPMSHDTFEGCVPLLLCLARLACARRL